MISYDFEQYRIIKTGAANWNRWRSENPGKYIDLSKANLKKAKLADADLSFARLEKENLPGTKMDNANFSEAIKKISQNTDCIRLI